MPRRSNNQQQLQRGPFNVRRNRANANNGNRPNAQNITTRVMGSVHSFSRVTETGYDVITDGINPTRYGFSFSLNSLPNPSDFTSLFDTYQITRIEIDWTPEYTELTDAALVSNAVNVRFNSCIDLLDAGAPSNVNTVLQYESLKSSSVTKNHRRTFVPCVLSDNMPVVAWQPTSNPSEAHYGVKVAIQPTGVPMTFHGRVKFYISCSSVN